MSNVSDAVKAVREEDFEGSMDKMDEVVVALSRATSNGFVPSSTSPPRAMETSMQCAAPIGEVLFLFEDLREEFVDVESFADIGRELPKNLLQEVNARTGGI